MGKRAAAKPDQSGQLDPGTGTKGSDRGHGKWRYMRDFELWCRK